MVVLETIKRNPRKRVFLCLFNIVDERAVALIEGLTQDVSSFFTKMGHINPRGRIIRMHAQYIALRKIPETFARFQNGQRAQQPAGIKIMYHKADI
jgi:hypothetical protein